jgi:hypothetical protein
MDELEQTSGHPPFLHANIVADARPTLVWGLLLLLVKQLLLLVVTIGNPVCEQFLYRSIHEVEAMDGVASRLRVVCLEAIGLLYGEGPTPWWRRLH